MKLILKIAAGVVIGLLLFQIISLKVIDIAYERDVKNLDLVTALHNCSKLLTNEIHSFYKNKKEVPNDLSYLVSFNYKGCSVKQKEGVFFLSFKNEWMSVEPYLSSEGIAYNCKITKYSKKSLNSTSCNNYTKLSRRSIPEFKN